MHPAAALTLTAAAALILTTHRRSIGQVEAGGWLGVIDPGALADTTETLMDRLTEQPAEVDADTADRNTRAFLAMLQRAEGTASHADPYRVVYGYRVTLADLSDHPATTGEWSGERLSDALCAGAGLGPGCRTTAAGAYQIIRPTWVSLKRAIGLRDFSPASQDAAAVELIRRRGALEDVRAGRVADAVRKCRREWASLPGSGVGQPTRSLTQLAGWFTTAGGLTA